MNIGFLIISGVFWILFIIAYRTADKDQGKPNLWIIYLMMIITFLLGCMNLLGGIFTN